MNCVFVVSEPKVVSQNCRIFLRVSQNDYDWTGNWQVHCFSCALHSCCVIVYGDLLFVICRGELGLKHSFEEL